MKKIAGDKSQIKRVGCPSFPSRGIGIERESMIFSQGPGFRLTTRRNDIFKGISSSMTMQLALLFCLVMVSLSNHAHAYSLPDTGQTKCYDTAGAEISCAGTGQDGEYNINPMSYTDNSNGTITDNNSGFMWQKCSVGQTNDTTCSGTAVTYNWYQASGTYNATYNPGSQNVCGSLNLGGYSDWRLPAKKELITIVDYSIPYPGPTINTTYFPNTISSHYWSSTTGAADPSIAWYVYFFNGYVNDYFKNDYGYVRCVRGGQ